MTTTWFVDEVGGNDSNSGLTSRCGRRRLPALPQQGRRQVTPFELWARPELVGHQRHLHQPLQRCDAGECAHPEHLHKRRGLVAKDKRDLHRQPVGQAQLNQRIQRRHCRGIHHRGSGFLRYRDAQFEHLPAAVLLDQPERGCG